MALWDIIEAIFMGGKKVSEQVVDRAYDKMDKMESEAAKFEKRARNLSDEELKEAYRRADGMSRIVYGKKLKNRGY